MRIYPRIFEEISQVQAVKDVLGDDPVRFFIFGLAPQTADRTYAVWQIVNGSPQNSLKCPVTVDEWTIQIDVYGNDSGKVRDAAGALIDAIEDRNQSYVNRFSGESRDPVDKSYRYSFDISWSQDRI